MLSPQDRGELTARISSLEATRSAAVDSADARLRQIERDLHDGAQHRLAFIGMELGRARAKLKTDPEGADAILATAHEESKRAMRELRDLVRGIHPSVLTDRGLDAALPASRTGRACPSKCVPRSATACRTPWRPPPTTSSPRR
jgi:signal transduction histidine kinase